MGRHGDGTLIKFNDQAEKPGPNRHNPAGEETVNIRRNTSSTGDFHAGI